MLKFHNYEEKTYEQALEKCLSNLNLTEADIFCKCSEKEAKLFQSKKIILTVLTKDDVKEFIKEFIKNIVAEMNINVELEIREEDEIFNVLMVSDANSILIGKDGRTLSALQLLLRQALQVNTGFQIKVNLDAGNYKAKKVKNFEYQMKKIMYEVEHSKVDATLDPMNSYQRRIIHNLATNFDHIITESTGEGKERHITIKYKED